MKPMRHVALSVSFALLVGCTTTFRPWLLSEIEEGMDRSQVIQILGEPDDAETKDGAEFLHYSYSEDYNPPPADDSIYTPDTINRKFNTQQVQRSFREYKYVVKLVDGKVLDYKERTE